MLPVPPIVCVFPFAIVQLRQTTVKSDHQMPARAGWRILEWARQIGCCRSTVYNLAAIGEIELVRVGGMTIVRTDPFSFLSAKAAKTQPERPPPSNGRRGRPKGSRNRAKPVASPAAEPAPLAAQAE